MTAYRQVYDAELTTVLVDTGVYVVAIPVQANLTGSPGSRYFRVALRTTGSVDAYYVEPSATASASLTVTTIKVPGADNDKIVTPPAYDATVETDNPAPFLGNCRNGAGRHLCAGDVMRFDDDDFSFDSMGSGSSGGGGSTDPAIYPDVATVADLNDIADPLDGSLCYVTAALAWYRYDSGAAAWQWARALWNVATDGDRYSTLPSTGVYSAAIANWYGGSVAGTARRSGSNWIFSQAIAGELTPTPAVSMPDFVQQPQPTGYQTVMTY